MSIETITAGLIKPEGYSAKYVTMKATACPNHQNYLPLCSQCEYREEYKTVTLGGEVMALIICPESGELLEWITTDTPWETAQNVATWGTLVISQAVWDMEEKPLSIVRAMHEATLHADCFGKELPNFDPERPLT